MSTLDRQLLEAQRKARKLLEEIENRKLIAIGSTEKDITDRIYDLAFELFGTKKHWHKRIVRSGPNTVYSYKVDPPNLELKAEDLVYLDLGPVFDQFEGDIGKTYLLGSDPDKERLIEDLERIFFESKAFYARDPAMPGAQLWSKVIELSQQAGWAFGNNHAGHIVGEFSHTQRYGDLAEHRINALNNLPMNTPGSDGQTRHWILEIHLVDRNRNYGGFFEDLLTLDG
jgi:Xaa-Pro aminopeptidase